MVQREFIMHIIRQRLINGGQHAIEAGILFHVADRVVFIHIAGILDGNGIKEFFIKRPDV